MRLVRLVGFVPVLALALGAAWAASPEAATAYTPSVSIVDNDAMAANMGTEIGQAYWGYAPNIIHVKKGDQVTFTSAATNKRPHSVTSISLSGQPFDEASPLAAGAKFDSSKTRDTLITVGNTWTLDTSTVDAGNYAYYCRIHPWMVGQITVLP